jgi:phenylalanyl-tRNA synthetase alpha chain
MGFLFLKESSMPENDILNELEAMQVESLAALEKAGDEAGLHSWKTANLGRTAPVMQVFTRLPQLEKELRAKVGQRANQVKQILETAFDERSRWVKTKALQRSLGSEKLDITLPGRHPFLGRLHPVTQTLQRITEIFAEMGFQTFRSREVETDEINFELLNIPPYHPARDMWDTFHTTKPGVILRTHTSPGQIHAMRQFCPEPIRVILPGMCYRYEQMDARHESQILQVEVLAVGKGITLGNLKGTLEEFARCMYGEDVRTRFRPSYFPFTEPSADMEIECFICKGSGCRVCSNTGWLEILGSGMVHPIVLNNGGYDPEIFSGFAAGMGVERVAMLRHSIEEIRYFYGNDIRFLEQF